MEKKIHRRTMNDLFFPIFSEAFSQLLPSLVNKRVTVIGHIRPDGDCVGSQIALCRILRAAKIDAVAYNAHPIPLNLKTFVGDTAFMEAAENFSEDINYHLAVDCSAVNRVGTQLQASLKKIHLCIDHHVSNPGFAEQNWIDANASATAEIIAGIAFDNKMTIDPVTAQALYVGIATDTGQFRYAATSERVFRLCALLLAHGADPHAAAHELYERESEGRVKLLQRFLETMESHLDGQLVFGKITQPMLTDTGTKREEAEGFIDYARNIDTVRIAAVLEEQTDGSVKVSLRSKFPEFQVDQLAARFNGGGHACAAGFHMNVPFSSFPEIFLKEVDEHLNQLRKNHATR
jgi:bifunctional oligoribonuclease and PAP phosphatase NrnA